MQGCEPQTSRSVPTATITCPFPRSTTPTSTPCRGPTRISGRFRPSWGRMISSKISEDTLPMWGICAFTRSSCSNDGMIRPPCADMTRPEEIPHRGPKRRIGSECIPGRYFLLLRAVARMARSRAILFRKESGINTCCTLDCSGNCGNISLFVRRLDPVFAREAG
jgi:hypothetical protein